MNNLTKEMFTTKEQDEAKIKAYEAELVRRYKEGLPLTKECKKLARKIIKQKGA